MKKLFLFFYLSVVSIAAFAAEQFVIFTPAGNHFPLVANGVPCPIYIDSSEDKGVMIAAGNLQQDILQVCGKKPELLTSTSSKRCIIAGTYGTPFIKKLMSAGKIDKKELDGKNEKYILQVIANPCEGIDEAVVIIGSDRRGTIYGIYELSEQMGVSPWYWWADVPVMKQANVYIKPGQYSDGEPAGTSGPISSITAPTSCPGITGNFTIGLRPKKVFRSEPQKPTYLILTNTSPAPTVGFSSSTTFISEGLTI